MKEEVVRLLQRQYRNYRDFLIDIDRAQEIEEQNEFNFRCLHCYCEVDEIDSREFDMDTSVEDFYEKYKEVCSGCCGNEKGHSAFCRFFKQGEDIVLSCFELDLWNWYDYEMGIVFKEKDFLDFCFQREDWNRIAVIHYGEESVFNQYKVFSQDNEGVVFGILQELCSIIIGFDRNQYDEND